MLKKLKGWFYREHLEDPFEASAVIAFGIGLPAITLIFALTLFLIKSLL